MKTVKYIVFVLSAVFLIVGCRKELSVTHIKNSSVDDALFAKWELRQTNGGLQPGVAYASGNGNIVQFNADSTYAIYTGGDAVSKRGTFHITKTALTMGAATFDVIYYDHATCGEPIVLQGDSLTIGTSAADGPSALYIRQ